MRIPKVGQNNIIKLLVNEFGTVPDSFRLVLEIFSFYSSNICSLPDSGRIRPLSQTFHPRTFLPLVYQRSFSLRCYLSSFLCETYFALFCVLVVSVGILSSGTANLDLSATMV